MVAMRIGDGRAEVGSSQHLDKAGRGLRRQWSPVFESADVELSRAHIAAVLSSHTLEHKWGDRAPVLRHRHGWCGALGFNEMSYTMHGGNARIAVPELPDIFLFELNLCGQAEIRSGREAMPLSAGQVCVINANEPHDKRWISDGRQIVVRVGQRTVHDALEAMIEHPIAAPLRFELNSHSVGGRLESLTAFVELICADLGRLAEDRPDASSGGLVSSRAAYAAERLFAELLIETIPNNYSHLIGEPLAPRPRSIENAINFIHAEARNEIMLDDIAAAAGLGARSLREGFRRYYASTPMSYLRAVRLQLAHVALRAGSAPVAEVALNCGFSHPSKFARAYRLRYGELPSETLSHRD